MKTIIIALCALLILISHAYTDDYTDYIVRGKRKDNTPIIIYRYPINSGQPQHDALVQGQHTYLIPMDGKELKQGDQFFELNPSNPEASAIIEIVD